MRKFLVVAVVLFLLQGCGKSKSEPDFKGVSAKKDYVSMGMTALKNGDIPNAIKDLDQAIKDDPKNPAKYIVLAEVYLKLQAYPRAIDTLIPAVRLDPTNGDTIYLLGFAYAMRGDTKEAMNILKKSAEIFAAQKQADKLKQTLVLLKSLDEGTFTPPTAAQ